MLSLTELTYSHLKTTKWRKRASRTDIQRERSEKKVRRTNEMLHAPLYIHVCVCVKSECVLDSFRFWIMFCAYACWTVWIGVLCHRWMYMICMYLWGLRQQARVHFFSQLQFALWSAFPSDMRMTMSMDSITFFFVSCLNSIIILCVYVNLIR